MSLRLKLVKSIKKLIRPNHYSNDAYVRYLRRGGAKIGDNTYFYGPEKHPVDESSLPWIEIGDGCRITSGVIILAHDYSYATLRKLYHCMIPKIGFTKIGNNVFIGMNAIVTMGSLIGDNVIIGAGSIVSGIIPSNVVVAGNPAKIICTMEEYHSKLEKKFVEYAKVHYEGLAKYLNRPITEYDMGWYNALWKNEDIREKLANCKVDGDIYEEVVNDVCAYPPKYRDFNEFVSEIKNKGEI